MPKPDPVPLPENCSAFVHARAFAIEHARLTPSRDRLCVEFLLNGVERYATAPIVDTVAGALTELALRIVQITQPPARPSAWENL